MIPNDTIHRPTSPRRVVAICAMIACVVGLFGCRQSNKDKENQRKQRASVEAISNLLEEPELALPDFETEVMPVLETCCLDCHSGGYAEADLDLLALLDAEDFTSSLEDWERVLDALHQKMMPPEEELQPTEDERARITRWIRAMLLEHSQGKVGEIAMRRLNRVEYENTIRDLFRMESHPFNNPKRIVQQEDYFDPASGRIPDLIVSQSRYNAADRVPSLLPGVSTPPVDVHGEHGFTNEGAVLTMSPLLWEKYYQLSTSIVYSPGLPDHAGNWESVFVWRTNPTADEAAVEAASRLQRFLTRAFRRPPTPDEIKRYTDLFRSVFDQTSDFTNAMQETVSAVLVSPNFLFIVERAENSDDLRPISDWELASRLSYFLWASMPDDELLTVAAEGRLQDDTELVAQTRRMMRDKKIKSLSVDFGMQWLKTHKVTSTFPDAELFPEYYRGKYRKSPPGVHMMIEQLLLFEMIMIEDRSILNFINSDTAFLNRKLMSWYRLNPANLVPDRSNEDAFTEFHRVTLPNERRGGVLTSGAMLMATSTPTRSSPIYRGTWILEVIFNRPPPPPPANVPSLEEEVDGERVDAATLREKLASHRDNPSCSVCHDRIDPLGFALENFDAVGRWRDTYENNEPIDASGTLGNGQSFLNAVSLKRAILRHQDEFVEAFVAHVLRYALGRRLEYFDDPTIQDISEAVLEDDSSFSSVIEGIVTSAPFRQTRTILPESANDSLTRSQ